MERHAVISPLEQNALWLLAMVVLLFAPGYYLVLGQDTEPFERSWFLDSAERARYGVIARRMLVWFLSAGVVGLVWSGVFGLFWGGSSS